MTSHTPQLILTLGPSGQLIAELPGAQATRRQLVLRDGEAAETIRRILTAQQSDKTEIGLDGAPTQAQVRHWERHGIWADSHCRFCLSEGKAKPDYTSLRGKKKVLVSVDRAGVEVRRIKSGQGAAKSQQARKSPEELGL